MILARCAFYWYIIRIPDNSLFIRGRSILYGTRTLPTAVLHQAVHTHYTLSVVQTGRISAWAHPLLLVEATAVSCIHALKLRGFQAATSFIARARARTLPDLGERGFPPSPFFRPELAAVTSSSTSPSSRDTSSYNSLPWSFCWPLIHWWP